MSCLCLESWIFCGDEDWNCNIRTGNTNNTRGMNVNEEEELHCLRAANQRLEHEAQTLMGLNRRLENELVVSREQFEGERVLVKCLKREIETEVKLTRDTLGRKYERNLAELKTRMELEQSHSLELQKLTLEKEFRAELMKCIHKKDSQLHLLLSRSQQVQRKTDQTLTAERQRYHTSYEIYLQQLKQDFKRQLTRLLLELKSKERKIGELERSLAIQINPTPTIPIDTHPSIAKSNQPGLHVCRRNKSYYRRSGTSHHPYLTDEHPRRKRHAEKIMKETDDLQNQQHLDDGYSYSSHHLDVLHHQYGGFPLETLPEVSEDESKPEESSSYCLKSKINANGNGNAYNGFPGETSAAAATREDPRCESQSSSFEFELENEGKVSILEATIRQLQEELKESREQNELLEFRLLELEEFDSPPNGVTDERGRDTVGKNHVQELLRSSEGVLCETEIQSDVTSNGDYESSNSHSSVAESRSSCSDCSESLSLQESGIFETQFSEERTGSGRVGHRRREEVGRELATLASQIESLVLSFSQEGDENGQDAALASNSKSSEFSTSLKYCRQRITEFEKRLAKFTDVSYMTSLEAKVNLLIQENRRLEDERAELEEAENDSRHQFQRLEEKIKEVRGKNTLLQQQLSNEKRFIEQLRIQILQLQEGEEELCSQLSRVESLAQNYEQRNFELEESQIEIKCNLQIALHSIPLLILWFLWNSRVKNKKSTVIKSLLPPPLPKSLPPIPASRKHKLRNENEILIRMIEPQLKKLKSEKEKSSCTMCMCRRIETVPKVQILSSSTSDVGSQTIENYLHCTTKINKTTTTTSGVPASASEESYKKRIKDFESLALRCEESEKEKVAVEEKWDGLIKELDQFALAVAPKDLNEGRWAYAETKAKAKAESEHVMTTTLANEATPSISHVENKGGTKIKGESLVANRIRSLFPDEWIGRRFNNANKSMPEISHSKNPNPNPNELIQRIQDRFTELRRREKSLLDEIHRLKSELQAKDDGNTKSQEILHLSEENNRLQVMLAEQEKVWLSVKELEDENEKLVADLTTSASLRRRLEEALAVEKNLRERSVEELEEFEIRYREMEEREKKSKKALDGLHLKLDFLSEEVEQLQDALAAKDTRESTLRSQMSKLKEELDETQQQLADSECGNGMLSEEIDALERALETAKHENEIQMEILRSELESKGTILKDTQRELGREQAAGRMTQQINDVMEILKGEDEQLLSSSNSSCLVVVKSDQPGFGAIAEQNSSLQQSRVGELESNLTAKEEEVQRLSQNIVELTTQLSESTRAFLSREKDIKECHLNEAWWWKWRCQEKNDLIHLLAKRLTHLSATVANIDDMAMNDYFLNGILKEIRQLRDSSYPPSVAASTNYANARLDNEQPQDCDSLLNFINNEGRRIMDLLKSTCEEIESPSSGPGSWSGSLDFRVLRRVGEDSLLVSWTIPEFSNGKVDGYEIFVNGSIFLRIRQSNRCKAILFGLDMIEPLSLSLRCTCAEANKSLESSITYIA